MAVFREATTISVLDECCRRELAVIESYRQSLRSLNAGAHTSVLAKALRSHERRVEWLAERIRFFRAQPPDSAGARGAVAKLAEGAAAAIGYQLGVAAVEDEEVRLTRLYLSRVLELDADSRKLMQKEIIPAQFETQRAVSELKQQAQATSWSQSP